MGCLATSTVYNFCSLHHFAAFRAFGKQWTYKFFSRKNLLPFIFRAFLLPDILIPKHSRAFPNIFISFRKLFANALLQTFQLMDAQIGRNSCLHRFICSKLDNRWLCDEDRTDRTDRTRLYSLKFSRPTAIGNLPDACRFIQSSNFKRWILKFNGFTWKFLSKNLE